jgi:hypothetical protein
MLEMTDKTTRDHREVQGFYILLNMPELYFSH